MQNLAVKAEEWNEPGVREGLYIASLIYMKQWRSDSCGSTLSSKETVLQERGEVIGEAARVEWASIDVRERYRAMKLKLSRHAFVSPFEMMEMLMAFNAEKEPMYRIRVGSTGKKIPYATLNIMLQSAIEQIESHENLHETDDEGALLEIYARRVEMPTITYLGRDGFKDEFQENALINGQMDETLSKCIYVGPSGSSEQVNQGFICQMNLRPCVQMMRYARGYKQVATEFWEATRIKLFLNVVALQRDVLKERREKIRWDPQLMRDRSGELIEIRKNKSK